ncbi:pilin [Patescibacteria group bacterium]|nr:pilin [Patescibacteria group bacterium]
MISSIKNKLQYALLAAPAYAATIELTPGTSDFQPLTSITISGIVSGAISLAMLAVALVFFFILILGGLRWIMSEGDQKNVETAKNQITNALIGLAIVFAAFAIMKLIETIFGINLLGGITIPTFNK